MNEDIPDTFDEKLSDEELLTRIYSPYDTFSKKLLTNLSELKATPKEKRILIKVLFQITRKSQEKSSPILNIRYLTKIIEAHGFQTQMMQNLEKIVKKSGDKSQKVLRWITNLLDHNENASESLEKICKLTDEANFKSEMLDAISLPYIKGNNAIYTLERLGMVVRNPNFNQKIWDMVREIMQKTDLVADLNSNDSLVREKALTEIKKIMDKCPFDPKYLIDMIRDAEIYVPILITAENSDNERIGELICYLTTYAFSLDTEVSGYDKKTKDGIKKVAMEFMQSKWVQTESNKNSIVFEKLFNKFNNLFSKMEDNANKKRKKR